jgi:hypothetical protein
VVATSDNQPDYKTNYFPTSDVCWESYNGAIPNPNLLSTYAYTLSLPRTPNTTAGRQMSAIVGIAVNGVAIFGNYAAPGDDIYTEARTFDRCGAHPQGTGVYHYHSEPYPITLDDDRFVGVMLDGYPIYGRRDVDGVRPLNLDAYGGHTGVTPDSLTATYHYHVNEQTSTGQMTSGQKQWFITTGSYRGSPGSCLTCGNM